MDKIILNDLDSSFKYEIASQAGAESFMRCFTCGTCTASCPVAEVHDEYDPRKIIRMAILGMRKEVLSSDILWMCSRCYTCYALCPQDVKFTDVVSILREMAVKDGYVPEKRLEQARELDSAVQALRTHIIEYKLHPSEKMSKKIKTMVDEVLKTDWS
jgi:heterodisulfide reductase subunit C